MRELTQRALRALLDYNPETGELIWLPRDRKWFATTLAWRTWNARFPGKLAFNTVNADGHLQGGLFNHTYLAHRIAWLWMTGHWPPEQIDHVNGNRADNRFANLREATASENAKNMAMSSRNRSGCVGVYRYRRGRHCATIKTGGQLRWLGHFATRSQAVRARKRAERELGFSPRHGRQLMRTS